MLRKKILNHWYHWGDLGKRFAAVSKEDTVAFQDFFQQLIRLPQDEVRGRLAGHDARQNRALAWFLLGQAVNFNIDTEYDQALKWIDWVDLIANYGEALKNQADCLEGHCNFYRGALKQMVGDPSAAQTQYALAEKNYTDAQALPELRGLAVLAQGIAALEAGDLDGFRSTHPGARERFNTASEILTAADPTFQAAVNSMIDRLLRQWDLATQLLAAEDPQQLLDTQRDILDGQILELLKGQAIRLAVSAAPVAEAWKAAKVIEQVATQIGQKVHFVDQLLAYYGGAKQFDKAEWLLNQLIQTRGKNLDLQMQLATALFMQAKYQQSRDLLEQLRIEQPDHVEIYLLLGRIFIVSQDIANARQSFENALALDPGNEEAISTLQQITPAAGFHFQDGRLTIQGDLSQLSPEERVAGMTAAILAADPQRVPERLAEIAQSDPALAGRVEQILATQGLVRKTKSLSEQHLERAERHFAQAQWAEAIEAYRLAVEADPDLAEAYLGWGDVYYRTGKYYLAIAYFEECNAIQPIPRAYCYIGDTYRDIGKKQHAIEAYQQALALDPHYGGARQDLQALLTQTGGKG